jgi:uncharacterized protein (DUF433 family)
MANPDTERITRDPGICGGKACIAGHRVRVMDVVIWHELMGKTADEIVSEFPGLMLSDVYAALTYYFDNMDGIREDMRSEDEIAEHFRAKYPSKLKEKLEGAAD